MGLDPLPGGEGPEDEVCPLGITVLLSVDQARCTKEFVSAVFVFTNKENGHVVGRAETKLGLGVSPGSSVGSGASLGASYHKLRGQVGVSVDIF